MIKIFTSYFIMIVFIVFQWLWLFLPDNVIWSIKEMDPDYLVKLRRLTPEIWDNAGYLYREKYMYSHDGYFLFKLTDFINDWRSDIMPYISTVGLFLLFSTLIYRKYLKLYTPTYVLGEAIGILYYFHTIMLWVIFIVTIMWHSGDDQNILYGLKL